MIFLILNEMFDHRRKTDWFSLHMFLIRKQIRAKQQKTKNLASLSSLIYPEIYLTVTIKSHFHAVKISQPCSKSSLSSASALLLLWISKSESRRLWYFNWDNVGLERPCKYVLLVASHSSLKFSFFDCFNHKTSSALKWFKSAYISFIWVYLQLDMPIIIGALVCAVGGRQLCKHQHSYNGHYICGNQIWAFIVHPLGIFTRS